MKGRRKHPWAQSLGISQGTVSRMSKGQIPGPETLGRIMRAENVSITWLTQGAGAPYLVQWFPTDEDCRRHLDELLAFQDWTVHRLSDGGRVEVVALYTDVERETGEELEHYTDLQVLAGGGRATLAGLFRLPAFRQTYADTDTVSAVASGQRAGTHELLGEGGLLSEYETITPAALAVAEDMPADYQAPREEPGAISLEERQWLELLRRLDSEGRTRLKEVGDAFVAARRVRRPGQDETGQD